MQKKKKKGEKRGEEVKEKEKRALSHHRLAHPLFLSKKKKGRKGE